MITVPPHFSFAVVSELNPISLEHFAVSSPKCSASSGIRLQDLKGVKTVSCDYETSNFFTAIVYQIRPITVVFRNRIRGISLVNNDSV